MFYVFYVNEGCLQPLEVSAALGSVYKLQCSIQKITDVPVSQQALLVSGGEGLQSENQVSHYQGAGTESNPVFMFSKLHRENDQKNEPPEINELNSQCQDMYQEIRKLRETTPSKSLIGRHCEVSRIAQQIVENSLQLCARLVQDHQLLHQGWLALVSNLTESRTQIGKKSERFLSRCERLKLMRSEAELLSQDFDSVLQILRQIKIPLHLLQHSLKERGENMSADDCTLYDYIARFDAQSSLENIAEQLNLLLMQMCDTDCKQVAAYMNFVNERVSNPEFKTIRGINTRLTQLDSMFHDRQQLEKTLKELCHSIEKYSMDSTLKDVVSNQRAKMDEVKIIVEQLQKLVRAFQQSKVELLNNIKTRLNGWILQVYDRLHSTNNLIILFDEKYIALRSRLDVIRQVKEAPFMYATSLAECLRRNTLQPEFEMWYTSLSEKVNALLAEESTVREVFKKKLSRHFLKQLFPRMLDSFSNSFPADLSQFDKHLPPVTPADLRSLRQAVPCLATLLKVTEPHVFQRLAVRDPTLPRSSCPSTQILKREESFYTSDATINITNLNKNFPSTHWLSGDENLDISPLYMATITKSPPKYGSTLSLDMGSGVSDKKDDSHVHRALSKSVPITIPSGSGLSRHSNTMSVGEDESSIKGKVSGKSSQFGTPDDELSYQQKVEDSEKNKFSIKCLSSVQKIADKLSEDLIQMRQQIVAAKDQERDELSKSISQITDSIIEFAVKNTELPQKVVMEKMTWTSEDIIDHSSYSIVDALIEGAAEEVEDKQIDELKQVIEKQNREIEDLRQQQLNAEDTISRLEAERNEMYRMLIIDHELAMDRQASSHNEEMKVKDREVRSLKATIQKLRESVARNVGSEKNDTSLEEVKANLEKECKGKMQLLLAGVEEKKAEEIARARKESAFDLRVQLRRYEKRISELEERIVDKMPRVSRNRNEWSASTIQMAASSLPTVPISESLMSFSAAEAVDVKSCMERSLSDAGIGIVYKDENMEVSNQQEESDEDIVPVTAKNRATQTTICLKQMRTMITVQDIHELCVVLIVWSDIHNAYILFSITPIFHFVKESSLKKMGINVDRQFSSTSSIVARPNWLMAIITRLELCKIRKIENRYNLKVGTKFYRVEVEPLQIDSSLIRHHIDE